MAEAVKIANGTASAMSLANAEPNLDPTWREALQNAADLMRTQGGRLIAVGGTIEGLVGVDASGRDIERPGALYGLEPSVELTAPDGDELQVRRVIDGRRSLERRKRPQRSLVVPWLTTVMSRLPREKATPPSQRVTKIGPLTCRWPAANVLEVVLPRLGDSGPQPAPARLERRELDDLRKLLAADPHGLL